LGILAGLYVLVASTSRLISVLDFIVNTILYRQPHSILIVLIGHSLELHPTAEVLGLQN